MKRSPTLLAPLVVLAILSPSCAYEPPMAKDAEGNEVPAVAVGPDGEPLTVGDTLQLAGNARALAQLRQAEIAVQVYAADTGTIDDLTSTLAATLEPNLTWNEAVVAIDGQISIRDRQPTTVVLVTKNGISTICAVVDIADTTVRHGTTDATTADACVGIVGGLDEEPTGESPASTLVPAAPASPPAYSPPPIIPAA